MDALNVYIDQLCGQSPLMLIVVKIAAVIVAAFIIWLLLRIVLSFVGKRICASSTVQFNDQFFPLLKKIVGMTVFFAAGTVIINLVNIPLLEKIFLAVFVILVAGPINGIAKVLLKFLEVHLAARTSSNLDDIVINLLGKFAGILIYITAVIIGLDILGVNVMPFVAGAGVAGVAIAFAAKDTLSNFIAGVLLLIDRPFEEGDRIEIWSAPTGSATWGDVTDIGLRATKIRTTDHIEIIIPNNEIMTRDIINYTATSSSIRVRVNIGISYDSDVATAKAAIVDIAKAIDWVQDDPPPKVVVRNFGESSVDLQLRVWIRDARKRMDTISEVTDKVKAAFDAAGIEIPYPKRDITIFNKQSK
jgi:small-conductance mechanosensitive channel